MKIGLILECGPDGADAKVCRHLISMINTNYDKKLSLVKPTTLGDKPQLIKDCGAATKKLLDVDKCERVIIMFDVDSKKSWNKGRDLATDRKDIFKALDSEDVDRDKVFLVGIIRELESWLISDGRALEAFLTQVTRHNPGRIKKARNPEHQADPKAWLNNLFREHWGKRRKYIDREHAEIIVEKLPDFREIKKCATFKRFVHKVAEIEI